MGCWGNQTRKRKEIKKVRSGKRKGEKKKKEMRFY